MFLSRPRLTSARRSLMAYFLSTTLSAAPVLLPEPSSNFVPKVEYGGDYNLVWSKLNSALGSNGIGVISASKNTGQIETDYIDGPTTNSKGNTTQSRYKFQITLTKIDPGHTKLTIQPILEAKSSGRTASVNEFHDVTEKNAAVAEKVRGWLYEQVEMQLPTGSGAPATAGSANLNESSSSASQPPAKPGFFASLADALKKPANGTSGGGTGNSPPGVGALGISTDTSQWVVHGVKLGMPKDSVDAVLHGVYRPNAKQTFEQKFKTLSGAFTTPNVVMGEQFAVNQSLPASDHVDDSGSVPTSAKLEIGYSFPTPGLVFEVRYTGRYDDIQHPNYDALPTMLTIKQALFGKLGNPAFARENKMTDRLPFPPAGGIASWGVNTGSITWIWAANSDYKNPMEFELCTDIKFVGSAISWMDGNLGNSKTTAPKCGQFLRVDLERLDVEHVYSMSMFMLDQRAYTEMSNRLDAFLDQGDAAAGAAVASVPNISTTPLVGFFNKYPYDGTPKTYYPRLAVAVTNWDRPKCWFATTTVWWSAAKSEAIGPFEICWSKGNFQWQLQSPASKRQFEEQKPLESSGNLRSKGPKPPLRAGLDTLPGDAVQGYNDFIHAFLDVTAWQPGAPTNVWIVDFTADHK